MDCVNHTGVNATAFCQNCGKALCESCASKGPTGQVLCEPCMTAWQAYQQQPPQQPFAQAFSGGEPHPGVAAVLGLIPGVGAMYNGQFLKGLIHIVIFAVLIALTDSHDIFGIFIAGWVVYQAFEAYHVAKARREGRPAPDPLRINELANWFNMGWRQPGAEPGQNATGYQQPNAGYYQQPTYAPPVAGAYPVDPNMPPMPSDIPSVPPAPPANLWRRREPIGAIVLIGLGTIFLLNQLHIVRAFQIGWPILIIALGVWLIVRRLTEHKGGTQ